MARQYTLDEIGQIIDQVAEQYKPGDKQFQQMLHALVFAESSGNNLQRRTNSKEDSVGLLQANRLGGRGDGYTVEQLQDPKFNLELGMKEIIKAYDRSVAGGKKGKDIVIQVSKEAQRPASGNELLAGEKWGTKIGGENKIHLPAENVWESAITPTSIPTSMPTPTPTANKPQVENELPLSMKLLTSFKPESNQMAYPTPRYIQNEPVSSNRPEIVKEKFLNKAKDIQQEYNKKNFFQKLLTPKPAFSAENDTGEKGYIRGSYVTQKYGTKNAEYYGKGFHQGTDYHASKGTPVYGLAGWQVLDTYKDYNLGNVLVMVNPNTGERVTFGHLDQTIGKRGDIITDNDTVIAKTGGSGKTIKGKNQQEHLHVEYTDQNGRTSDITKSALLATNQKAAEKGNPLVVMPKIVKPVMAAEKEEPYYSQKGWEQSQAKTFDERVKSGEYYGKSQGSYQIKPGDTLSALAKQYRTTVDDFVRSNPTITNKNLIRAGEVISVPSAPTDTNRSSGYVVRSGDTLTSIAKKMATTVNDLARKNNIVDINKIYTGIKLKI